MFSSKLFRPAQQLSKVCAIRLVYIANGLHISMQCSLAD